MKQKILKIKRMFLFLWYTFESDTIIARCRHVGLSESEVTIFRSEGGAFGSAA